MLLSIKDDIYYYVITAFSSPFYLFMFQLFLPYCFFIHCCVLILQLLFYCCYCRWCSYCCCCYCCCYCCCCYCCCCYCCCYCCCCYCLYVLVFIPSPLRICCKDSNLSVFPFSSIMSSCDHLQLTLKYLEFDVASNRKAACRNVNNVSPIMYFIFQY